SAPMDVARSDQNVVRRRQDCLPESRILALIIWQIHVTHGVRKLLKGRRWLFDQWLRQHEHTRPSEIAQPILRSPKPPCRTEVRFSSVEAIPSCTRIQK